MRHGTIMSVIYVFLFLYFGQAFTRTGIQEVPVQEKIDRSGNGIELSCKDADKFGYEIKTIVWQCQGCFSISETRRTTIAKLFDSRYDVLVESERISWKGTNLFINPSATQDSGVYFCLINSQKTPSQAYNLQIQDVPSKPGKPLVMSFNSTSVNLSWAPPLFLNSAPLISYKLEILEGESSTWTNYVTINTGMKESFYTVTNLRPFTVYSFRVIAVNRLGPSSPSEPSYHMMTLREHPRGKPIIVKTYNLSSDSIQIEWDPPSVDTIHGEFIGYKISWKETELGDEFSQKSVIIKDPETKEFRITQLKSFTRYLILIQVMNPKGTGPPAKVNVKTDEGVPSQPLNLSVVAVTNNGFILQWVKPETPNGLVTGYRVYYSSNNFTNVRTINSSDEIVSGEVDGLEPYQKFNIFVKAFNSKNEGNASDSIQVMTDVSGPSSPILTNLTCPSSTSVFIEWTKPSIFYHSIEKYIIYYKKKNAILWLEKEKKIIHTSKKELTERTMIRNLTVGEEYSFYIIAFSQSLYIESLQYPGNKSERFHILAGKECDRVQVSPMREGVVLESKNRHIAVVLGGTFVFLLLLLVVLALAYWRRNLMGKRFYIPAGVRKDDEFLMWDMQVENEDSSKTSIQSNMFSQHVHLLHVERDVGFLSEYQNLQQSFSLTGKLVGRQEDQSSLQIYNIDSFQCRNSYTLCMSPQLVDPLDFWRYLNKSNASLLVSVDTEIDSHLPLEARSFGSIDVIPVSKRIYPSFTSRKFEMRLKKGKKTGNNEIILVQFKTPIHGYRKELDFLRFIRFVSNLKKTNGIPLVLSGRSIVYLSADSLILQLESTNEINIPAYIRYLGSTIGIEELTFQDYIFLHEVLKKAVLCKGSSMSATMLSVTNVSQTIIDKQFSFCTDVSDEKITYQAALEAFNQCRNNSLDYIAPDWSRVILCCMQTDYINASWIPGYSGEKEFILSQHPSPSTISQFWEMILQTESKLIVCLSVIPHQFWPSPQTKLIYQDLSIWLESEGNMGGYRSHMVKLEKLGQTINIELVLCPNWPHQSVPVSNCVHLVDCINKKICTGPVVVVDSYGATEAGIFCVLSSLVRQMDLENSVDLFYWFKALTISRPGIWISPDNIVFVYRVLSELCSIHRSYM